VVVVAEMRRADAEPDERNRACGGPRDAVAVRVELLTRAEAPLDAVARADVEAVQRGVAERRGHQVIRLEERAVRAGPLQPHTLESRSDEVGRGAVLLGVGEPS